MPRPLKTGIDYFPLDTDFFADAKIRRLTNQCGKQAALAIIFIYCEIYRHEGTHIRYDENLVYAAMDECGQNEKWVRQVVAAAVDFDIFDEMSFRRDKILTSHGIIKRFEAATATRKRVRKAYQKNKATLPAEEPSQPPNEQTQPNATPLKVRAVKFHEEIMKFTNVYPAQMLEDFFAYWSEPNRSSSKMRVEMQPTWELSRRLGRWAANQKIKTTNERPANPYANFAASKEAANREALDRAQLEIAERLRTLARPQPDTR